jgi:hypothetical protein
MDAGQLVGNARYGCRYWRVRVHDRGCVEVAVDGEVEGKLGRWCEPRVDERALEIHDGDPVGGEPREPRARGSDATRSPARALTFPATPSTRLDAASARQASATADRRPSVSALTWQRPGAARTLSTRFRGAPPGTSACNRRRLARSCAT